MATGKPTTQTISIDSGIPRRGSKDGYLQNFFLLRQNAGHIIMQAESYSDPRILLMTEFLISGVTDDNQRDELFQAIDQIYQDNIDMEGPDLTEEEKARIFARCCMRVIGHVTAWYDEFLGITTRLETEIILRGDNEDPPKGFFDKKDEDESGEEDDKFKEAEED